MARLHASSSCALTVSVLLTATAAVLCAQTPRQPMKDDKGAAQLVSFTGRVVVQRQNSPWRLDIGEYVYPLEVISTGSDGDAMFKVSDGSTFEVFPNSKVVFRANNFNWQDLLELWLGKVRIQIEHPGGVPNNNKIRTPTAVISVRGTIFDVQYDPDGDNTLVYDEEGSVEVARALRLNETRVLNPGEHVVVYKNESLAPASIDKGELFKRVFRSLMDAVTQEAINSRTSTPSPTGPTPVPTPPGDKNTNTPPPPPSPAP